MRVIQVRNGNGNWIDADKNRIGDEVWVVAGSNEALLAYKFKRPQYVTKEVKYKFLFWTITDKITEVELVEDEKYTLLESDKYRIIEEATINSGVDSVSLRKIIKEYKEQ